MNQDESLIDLIYEGPIEQDPWASFLHACRLHLNSSSALLMFRLPMEMGETVDIADTNWYTHTVSQLYYGRYAALNPLKYESMQAGRAYTFSDFVDEGEFRRSSYYIEYCRPLGIDHAVVFFIGETQGLRAWLNLSRSDLEGPYAAREINELTALFPHMHRALRIYSKLERQRLENQAYRCTSDSLNLSTLLLNEDGRVGSVNDSFNCLMESHPAIAVRNGRLVFSKIEDQRQFDTQLRALLSGKVERDYRAFVVGAGSSRKLSILMRRMPRQGADMRHTEAAVVVYLKESSPAYSSAKTEIVSTLFGLTLTESKLAVMLADGGDLKKIAAELGITEQTARTYSKRIFSKTGTSRQAELVRLILTSLASVAV